MTGIILAGGKNSRMGRNKAFLKIADMKNIEIIVNKLRDIFEEIIIVSNSIEEYQHLDVRLVKDIIPNKGSLVGLYSGLVNSKNQYSFVVACDMPFLNVELIKFMKNNCDGFDVIIPKLKNGYEPLHTIYSKNCIGPIEKQIEGNNLKIIDFFSHVYLHTKDFGVGVKVKEISEDTIRQFDSQLLSFFNINTDADYQKALRFVTANPGQTLNIAQSIRT